MFTQPIYSSCRRAVAYVLIGLAPVSLNQSIAQTTDIATAPLVTASSASVKPNILFILDDSGSMASRFMPDEANDFRQREYGYTSSQCNGVYYDPTIEYITPIKADGTSYPNSTFTAAWNNGFDTTAGTTNLSNNFQAGDETAAQAAFYHQYSGTQTTAKLKNYFSNTSQFYQECNSDFGVAPGSSVFTKVLIGTDAAAQKNFANWYSYYRSRMLMAKSAAGLAFKGIDNGYRVAYMSINNAAGASWLDHGDFTGAHRTNWFAKLYGAETGNSTPLRQALSRGGSIYAGKITSLYDQTVTDPIQYSCQQNFTILTTDGYWNGAAGFQLDGATAIGNQDGTEPRPRFDGLTPAKTKVVTTTVATTSTMTVSTLVNTRIIKQRATTPSTFNQQWNRSLVSANNTVCNAASSNPANCIQVGIGGSRRFWCATNNPIISLPPHTCVPAAGSGGVFLCRSNNTSNPPGGSACKTDTGGVRWCVYSNNSTADTSSCTRAGAGIDAWICRAAEPKYTITTQPQRYTQVVQRSTVSENSRESRATSVTTTTNNAITTTVSTTIDGTPVPPDVVTNSTSQTGPNATGPTTVTDPTQITSGPTTTETSNTGTPTAMTAWGNNGGSSSVCAVLPTTPPGVTAGGAGVGTAAVAGSTSNSTGTTATTTLSDDITPVTTTVVTNPTVAPTTSVVTTTIPAIAGSSDSLSDVAQYYYVTDLRTADLSNQNGVLGTDVSENNVPASGKDSASWQHMTTFTLGIGALGRMVYSPTYETDTSCDYFDVKNGSSTNTATGVCSWQATVGSACKWPTARANEPESIDDLWHAAVNGRGAFFAATNPTSLATAISNALSGVSARTGSSAAATTSNPNVTSGDNFVFESTFVTAQWSGQLVRKQLDLETGVVKPTEDWAAQSQLDANTGRVLYTRDDSATNGLRTLSWANLTTAEKAHFQLANINTLSQFCTEGAECLDATAKADAAGEKLFQYLLGDRTNEGVKEDATKYFRVRAALLGDIVNAEAVFVRKSTFNYADTATETGYAAFKASNETRAGSVYVAANDGFMHAFDSDTGAERWAYAPTRVFPNMYKLADKNYANQHQYFLDGTPRVQDVFDGTSWRTILVAGMNAGGRGYYALDVTNPTSPKSLWEFTDNNLGFTFGNPEVVKLKNGTWVAIFGSGYNNVSPGDGVGRLYVVNAVTGALIRTISTGVGSATAPSGLSRVVSWVDKADVDNTALRIYGGDLLGNLWRFDINNDIGAAGFDAHRLVTLVDGSGVAQPITGKPEIGEVNLVPVILIGTGRYLGTTDLANTQPQSFYAVKDTLDTVTLGNPRITTNKFIKQIQGQTTCPASAPATLCSTGQIVRTSTNNAVDFATDNGWYVDLLDSGERINTDSQLALGTLVFNANVPSATACNVGGYSNRYFLDFRTGAPVSTAGGLVGARLGNALATRPVIVRLPNNTVVALTRLSDGTTVTNQVPIAGSGEPARRVSWRELVN